MKLFLVRHGETGAHYASRYIGATDLPLSTTGRNQARRLATILPVGISRCLCSPMLRARETAELALVGLDCRLEILNSLREINFGRWDGLSFAEIASQDQDLVVDWQRDALAFQFPEGEHTLSFWLRIEETLHWIVALPEDSILVICHGGVIRAMLCSLLGIPFEKYLLFSIKPAALTLLEVDGHRGVLQCLNG